MDRKVGEKSTQQVNEVGVSIYQNVACDKYIHKMWNKMSEKPTLIKALKRYMPSQTLHMMLNFLLTLHYDYPNVGHLHLAP